MFQTFGRDVRLRSKPAASREAHLTQLTSGLLRLFCLMEAALADRVGDGGVSPRTIRDAMDAAY